LGGVGLNIRRNRKRVSVDSHVSPVFVVPAPR